MLRTRFLLALLGCSIATTVFAQSPETHASATPTRGVVVFTDLEKQLATAIGTRQTSDVDRLLAADFEQREATMPGSPLPRAQWLAQATAGSAIRDMAVHDFGTVAVVSFLDQHRPDGSDNHFVVDVWRNDGGKWQLQVRYQAPPLSLDSVGDVKPTGKN